MLYALWRLIQYWLPFWVVVRIYQSRKAIPATIKTRSGRTLKAIMINDHCGIICTTQHYIHNRTKKLRQKQLEINEATNNLMREMNTLSFDARESIMSEDYDETSNN